MLSLFYCAARACRVTPVVLMACALACPGAALAASLSLAEAQQRAVERSMQLRGQDAAIAASQALAGAARQLPDPTIKAGVDNLPIAGQDKDSLGKDAMTMRRIGIEQELTGGTKRALRAERYERLADKTRTEQVAATAAAERDTALAWLDVYYASRMAQVLAGQAREAGDQVIAADAAYRGGRGSRADLLAARSAAAMVADRAAVVERQRINARTMLARWVGEPADPTPGSAPDITRIRHDPDTLALQLDHHPEVSVLTRAEEVARTEARLADAESRPDWRIELAYQNRGSGYPNMVSFGVAVPLQWDRPHRQDREVAARLSLADQARDERDEALRMHTAETQALVGDWRTGLERLDRYRKELLPLAQERADALLAAYRGGTAALTDVLGGRAAVLDISLQALQLEAETARLWARLNFLFPTKQTYATAVQEAK
jgi:outer membrane protein TolC